MLVPFSEIQMLQHVRKLVVSDCDSLVEVFESVGEVTKKRDAATHYQLQEMTLNDLPRLCRIWKHNIIEFISFQSLTKIFVFCCHNLKSLLSHSMARSLLQLQKIVVENCEIMEEIITMEVEYIEGNKVKILFPKLEELRLYSLPKLECVCSGDYDYDLPLCSVEENMKFNNNDKVQISFPQLKEIELLRVPKLKCFCSGAYDYNIMLSSIKECPNMSTFPYGNIVVNTPNLHTLNWPLNDIQKLGDLNLTIYYFQNSEKYKEELQKLETFRDIIDEDLVRYIKSVASLEIVNYHKLVNCIPSNMMQLFSHLRELYVRECECLEEIFESNDSMSQCELEILDLSCLPELKHIWKNHGQILGFKCLRYIFVMQCNDLEYVLPDVSVVTSLPKLYSIYVSNCKKMKEIIGNNCVQQKAKIKFPSLCEIYLKKLPSLKCFSQSSFPCYAEMPKCEHITIEDCPEMKTFWYEGILYTQRLYRFYVENTKFDTDEDVNEVIQRTIND